MLRIRTGARYGLRWGVFGFVAAVFTIPGNPAQAAPYADIVVDANSGTVLHSTNPDARRHPASLTKIMTLYMLFEQLEAGALKLDSQLKVSAEAAAQAPTKLGLKPGGTIAVEDAIKGLVTRSANDAAVVVAEAIAGTERDFAKLMTRKAQALGMKSTVYKNASGLPDSDQITTARDQSVLGRAVQERFPRYYKYFSIRSFTFRGQSISNHNHLLGRVEGVDGIKTGYINASGFNLVTSVHRGNRYLVAVVMGGGSAGSRDARMRELINGKIVLAATKRTAPMVGESVETADAKPEPKVAAKVEPKPEPSAEAKAEAKAEPRFAVASAVSVPTRFIPSAAPAEAAAARSEPTAATAGGQPRLAAGSTEPIRPVLVKTLAVKAGTQTASLAPLVPALPVSDSQPSQAAAPAPVIVARLEPPAPPAAAAPAPTPVAVAKPEPAAAPPAPAVVAARLDPPSPAPAPLVVAKPEPPAAAPVAPAAATKPEPTASAPAAASANAERLPLPLARPGTLGALPGRTAAAQPAATAKPALAPTATAATPAPAAASKPSPRGGWVIQVGAYPAEGTAKERLAAVRSKASKVLTGAEGFTEPVQKSGTIYYRARFAGLDKDRAEAACKYLKKNDVECVPLKN
jgi:D-alanyl-D-alanine carboxypeptidase